MQRNLLATMILPAQMTTQNVLVFIDRRFRATNIRRRRRTQQLHGLSVAQLALYPTRMAAIECAICWEGADRVQSCRRLSCMDEFHSACVDQWLKDHNTCPICRHLL